MIGRAIAHQVGASFFNISASSLMSKWIGEGEKTIKALFAVARYKQPSVVFIDEIDALLSQRSDKEEDSTRRIKNELLVQMDGVGGKETDKVIVLGATNRPHQIDDAARRRLTKRLYIPLPDDEARRYLINRLLKNERHSLTQQDVNHIVDQADGYSGDDLTKLLQEAAMAPMRHAKELARGDLDKITPENIPPISMSDIMASFSVTKPTVTSGDLQARCYQSVM